MQVSSGESVLIAETLVYKANPPAAQQRLSAAAGSVSSFSGYGVDYKRLVIIEGTAEFTGVTFKLRGTRATLRTSEKGRPSRSTAPSSPRGVRGHQADRDPRRQDHHGRAVITFTHKRLLAPGLDTRPGPAVRRRAEGRVPGSPG